MLPDKDLWSAEAMSIYQDQPFLYGPLLAIDDILVTNTSGTFVGLYTSEEGDHYPRLRIDLPSFIGISKVIVYFGREECCSFLQNFEVRIGTNPDLGSDQSLNQENNTLCGNVTTIDDIQLNAAVIRCTYPIWGQYIFIQGLIKAEEQHFIVNEVSVYTLNISSKLLIEWNQGKNNAISAMHFLFFLRFGAGFGRLWSSFSTWSHYSWNLCSFPTWVGSKWHQCLLWEWMDQYITKRSIWKWCGAFWIWVLNPLRCFVCGC